jgi:RNA polymerase sigma factor (sigma-70 family)
MLQELENHFRTSRGKIVKFVAYRIGGDDHAGEDIVQESYYRALKYIDSCREGEFSKWFSVIVKNAMNDYRNQDTGTTDTEDYQHEELIECFAVTDSTLREVNDLISERSPDQQEILNLHFTHGYSPTDIMRITPHSYSKCQKSIERFREKIRELYFT